MPIEYNPKYIHHKKSAEGATIREIVFGVEDGMVSTLGSVTGIATGTGDPFTVILAGFVIIAVESISMGVGSYLANKSEREVKMRKLEEEREEIEKFPEEEERELVDMYKEDGWPEALSKKMAKAASKNKELFLKEMAYRELKIIPDEPNSAGKNGLYMWISYIIGGSIPLTPYVLLPLESAIFVSVIITVIGLFGLGVFTTRYTKRSWYKAGFEMLILASAAALAGYAVGRGIDELYLRK